jgi:multidrug resistance efflux pump
MHKNKRIIAIIVLVVVLAAVGAWYIIQARAAQADGSIEASGTVEAVEILVSPEQAGRVEVVLVEKGNPVDEGELLFRLDDDLLQTQRSRAVTALDTAEANLSTAETGLEIADAALNSAKVNLEVVKAKTEVELIAAKQALDDLYDSVEVARGEALQNAAAANRAVREAQYRLDNFSVPTNQQDFSAMEAIQVMKEALDEARDNFEPYKYEDSGNDTREELKEDLDEAQSDYDSAVRRLEYETAFDKAQAALDKAMEDLAALKDGPDPEDIEVLEARIAAIEVTPKQAEAAVESAVVGLSQAQAQLEQAQTAISQAQAELDLIEAQIEKTNIYASQSGVVLSKNVQPGEVVQPGAPVMTIGQLDDLTITVYVPEDRYGQINLGDQAEVTVDSFPGEVFPAEVIYIADQAEFTPRNVQTAEGRRTTVFAVELRIENLGSRLKPGMPADVCFECN